MLTKRIKQFASLASLLTSFAFVALPARAQVMQAEYLGTHKGENISINVNGSATSVFAGQLSFRLNTGPGYTTLGSAFDTYCIDLLHHVGGNDKYPVLITPTGLGLHNGGEVAYLFNTYAPLIADNDHAAGL